MIFFLNFFLIKRRFLYFKVLELVTIRYTITLGKVKFLWLFNLSFINLLLNFSYTFWVRRINYTIEKLGWLFCNLTTRNFQFFLLLLIVFSKKINFCVNILNLINLFLQMFFSSSVKQLDFVIFKKSFRAFKSQSSIWAISLRRWRFEALPESFSKRTVSFTLAFSVRLNLSLKKVIRVHFLLFIVIFYFLT